LILAQGNPIALVDATRITVIKKQRGLTDRVPVRVQAMVR
jgi:hypothetical protein